MSLSVYPAYIVTAKVDFVLFCLLVTNLIIRLSFSCLTLIRSVDKVSFKKRCSIMHHLSNQDKAIMIIIYS